jgi:excisionase family DNA binding protein
MFEKNLFTLSETAKIIGVSLTTVRRWSASGQLSTVHFSRRTVRVSRHVLEALINGGLPVQSTREAN